MDPLVPPTATATATPSANAPAATASPSDEEKAMPSRLASEGTATAAAADSNSQVVGFCGVGSADYYDMATLEMESSETEESKKGRGAKRRSTPLGLGRPHDGWSRYHVSEATMVQICYLAIFAIFGTMLRVVIAQLFGEECANPGTVGWLASGSPLCVTKDGETSREGGIVFADLPSNLLGSFIMGLLQHGDVLGLPINMQLAFLSPTHVLQSMPILHLAWRTGFCGSLTTYSSWNSEMIVMMFGTGGKATDTMTFINQFIRALFGYLIGMETAIGSFEFGKIVARWWHSTVNPLLTAEGIASEQRMAEGVYLNRDLPDFERRFLPDLPMETYGEVSYPMHQVESLERWRQSTVEVRRVGHPLLPTLIEIETAVLVHEFQIQFESDNIARANGWDVDALREWVLHRSTDAERQPSSVTHALDTNSTAHSFLTLPVAGSMLGMLLALLLYGVFAFNGDQDYEKTDRTTCYSMLFSPLGAILRWQLGQHLNGKWAPLSSLSWMPFGTWAANFLASCISVAMIATELRVGTNYSSFWVVGTLRAVRIGFSGCLSTVSSFAAEVSSLKKKDRAYTYVMITLTSTCLVGSAIYGLILFA